MDMVEQRSELTGEPSLLLVWRAGPRSKYPAGARSSRAAAGSDRGIGKGEAAPARAGMILAAVAGDKEARYNSSPCVIISQLLLVFGSSARPSGLGPEPTKQEVHYNTPMTCARGLGPAGHYGEWM